MDRDLAIQLITKLGEVVTKLGTIVTKLEAVVTELNTIAVNTTPADSGEPDAEPAAVENTRSAKK